MALPYKIDTNDLIEFVKVYNHENSGKEWSVDSFRTALKNWVNPTKIVCASQKVEKSESNCNLHSVVKVERSETPVKCVLCGAKLHEHELKGGSNCCDICWLST